MLGELRPLIPVFLAFLLLLCGCAVFGGDMPIRVTGEIPRAEADLQGSNCELRLVYADSGRVYGEYTITNAIFQKTFVVAARRTPYYFLVECQDGRKFRSLTYHPGGSKSFNKLIELGVVTELDGVSSIE